jgi:hypothetical protein
MGLGAGMGLQTKNGLIKILFANGNTNTQKIKFYNTMVNLCYNVVF